jgi:hypothetical protein
MAEAWIAVSNTYKCIECGEYMISLFLSYGEPAVFEYPLLCRSCWRDLKNALKTILKHGREFIPQLLAQLLDFIEAR